MTHTVQPDETTTSIALRYGITNEDLVEANPTKGVEYRRNVPVFQDLEVGEVLSIPE